MTPPPKLHHVVLTLSIHVISTADQDRYCHAEMQLQNGVPEHVLETDVVEIVADYFDTQAKKENKKLGMDKETRKLIGTAMECLIG